MAISADFVLEEIKGIKESFDNGSKLSIDKYKALPIFNIESTDEWSEIFNSTESMDGARELTEQETPDITTLEEGYNVTLVTKRFGSAIEVSETAMQEMDDTSTKVSTFLMRERDKVLRKNRYLFVKNMHKFLNESHDSGSDFLAPDGVEICGSHSWNTAGSTAWDNSATATLSSSAVDAAMLFGGAFVDGSGEEMPQTYDTIVVKLGSAPARMAKKLFAEGITPTHIDDVNIYEGEFTIIELPLISVANTNYWWMFDTKQEKSPLYMGIKKYPTMNEPIKQNNEAVRSNVTGFWKQGVTNMPYMIYGSTGTA